MTKPIIDIDGDGKPDVGWAVNINKDNAMWSYGFTTASGATSSVGYGIAGGSIPDILFADSTGKGGIVAIISYSRGASLYVVSGCRLVAATDAKGQPYEFDLGSLGNGTGVGCSTVAGASGQTLVGLNIVDANGKSTVLADNDKPAKVTRTQVLIQGSKAMNGLTDTIPVTGADDPVTQSARDIACGDLTAAKDGIAPPTMS